MQGDWLASYLKNFHLGAEHAATGRELEQAFGLTARELRDLVNTLRREGVPIASGGSGYYYARTAGEVYATIRHMKRRIGGICAAIHGLEQSLEQFYPEQLRLPLNREPPD